MSFTPYCPCRSTQTNFLNRSLSGLDVHFSIENQIFTVFVKSIARDNLASEENSKHF